MPQSNSQVTPQAEKVRGGKAFSTPRRPASRRHTGAPSTAKISRQSSTSSSSTSISAQGKPTATTPSKRDATVQQIEKIEKQRALRRLAMAEYRRERREEEAMNEKMGNPGDVDFQRMIKQFREEYSHTAQPLKDLGMQKICICVRKRPVNEKEVKKRDYDAVTCLNPAVIVHDCKLKVDGISKYLDNNEFKFDHAFDEETDNYQVYCFTAQPLVRFIFEGKNATVFAYGQTGSGKTYTMSGIQRQAAHDIFRHLDQVNTSAENRKLGVFVSFFEIYGSRCQDLLHKRTRLTIREDGKGLVQIAGLQEREAHTVEELLAFVDKGNRLRTTHATDVNDTSSRSHGICQITLRHPEAKKIYGKLSLVDLAGSERAADTRHHDRQRRIESAEINKSLLGLKECIRALDGGGKHVPYRASKLTLILKDSFVSKSSRTVMIATVSPCASNADHTVNTLRYADRVKEQRVQERGPVIDASVSPDAKTMVAAYLDGQKAKQQPGVMHSVDVHTISAPSSSLDRTIDPTSEHTSTGESPAGEQKLDAKRAPINAWGEGLATTSTSPTADSISPSKKYVGENSAGTSEEVRQTGESLHPRAPKAPEEEDYAFEVLDALSLSPNLTEEDLDGLDEEQFAGLSLGDLEEDLLNDHMESIQENAALLTEEGQLLAAVQGDGVIDYDIDAYTSRLDEILRRKLELTSNLLNQLTAFRARLAEEERQSFAGIDGGMAP